MKGQQVPLETAELGKPREHPEELPAAVRRELLRQVQVIIPILPNRKNRSRTVLNLRDLM